MHVTFSRASSKPKCWEAADKHRIENIDGVISVFSDGVKSALHIYFLLVVI